MFKHFEIYKYYCKDIMHTTLNITFLQKKKKKMMVIYHLFTYFQIIYLIFMHHLFILHFQQLTLYVRQMYIFDLSILRLNNIPDVSKHYVVLKCQIMFINTLTNGKVGPRRLELNNVKLTKYLREYLIISLERSIRKCTIKKTILTGCHLLKKSSCIQRSFNKK